MNRHSLRTILEVSTNVAVLLVAASAVILLTVVLLREPPKAQLTSGLEKGNTFEKLPSLDYGATDRTLLIAISTTCPYCRESLPLYRRTLELQAKAGKTLRVAALFPDSVTDVANYLKENQLTIDAVPGVDFRSLHISTTPTMVLVNDHGRISDFWTGKLDEREVEQFEHSLKSEKASSP